MSSTLATTDEQAKPAAWGPRGAAAATFPARLTFEHITHTYENVEAVKDVSLEVGLGEIICLLGPSGCGKTTLLRIAAGVERPQKGRILIDSTVVAGPNTFVPPERRHVGLMFQDFALFPHLSILDNVMFGLRSLDRSEAVSEARAALRRVGMSEFENAYPHVLSGGEQQRVALARAIVPRPSVLLMDEPFSGLDQRLRESVRDETLAVLRETGASCVLVTHDPVEAMSMADRIAVMRSGRLVQVDSPRALYSNPVDADTARFFDDFNEFVAPVKGKSIETPLGKVQTPEGFAAEHALVLVRPRGVVRAAKGKGIEGWVVHVKYLGDTSVVSLAIKDLDAPISVRVDASETPEMGQAMHVRLDKDHVLVFEPDH